MVEGRVVQQNLSGLHRSELTTVAPFQTNQSTRLSDNRQDPWFGIVIPVSTNSQVDFPREGIGFVRRSELKYVVGRCKGDAFPDFWMVIRVNGGYVIRHLLESGPGAQPGGHPGRIKM